MHPRHPASSCPTALPQTASNRMGRGLWLREDEGAPGKCRSVPLKLALAALSTTLITATAQAALPSGVMTALQAANVPPEAVSMLVLPVDMAAPVRLDHDSQAVRQIASVMKLFTTGAALNALGPAYAWRTDVALGGPLKPNGKLDGPLYLRGSGDPSLVLEYVQLMMARWRAAGLNHIQGDILIDREAFDIPAHNPAAFDGQGIKPYNAGPDALLLNHQAISLRVMPDAARPGQIRVAMEPELDEVRLDPHVRPQNSGACGDWREGLTLNMKPAAGRKQHGLRPWTLSVSGPYPASCGMKDWPVLWQGDGVGGGGGDYAARLLSATWKRAGGKLGGDILPGRWPAQGADPAAPWQSWTSPPLGQIVRDINKFSNNVMARQLFLTLGGQQGGWPATLDKARAAVTQQVQMSTRDSAGKSPCEGEALVLDNGSGLSRNERSSARCLGRWLQSMWAMPTMPEFIASLPISGTDGTARRLQSVAGRAHLKTGSLDGVAALAGYVEGESGHRYVVVAVINHPQADAARPAMEALVAWAMRDKPAP